MKSIAEYINAFLNNKTMKQQLVHHKIYEAQDPCFAMPLHELSPLIQKALLKRGITKLYSHQAKAINTIRQGKNLVITSPTASGKSLVYTIPILEKYLQDTSSHALYLFPLKALARDQYTILMEYLACFPKELQPSVAIYDGDNTPYERQKIRKNIPNIIITNPDMLHLSILPHHKTWANFFANLSFIVLDEAHTYRGVFGSHMAQVFRRIQRICYNYHTQPQHILCTATIGNPKELSENLLGTKNIEQITESGAPQGKKHILMLNPDDAPSTLTIDLIKAALKRQLRTIVYCRSRKMTELISLWATNSANIYKNKISAYRSGFLPEERRQIEENMANGNLLCVVSTSALELGIDIGNLDLCILVGYPGTIMSTLQRSGRVGRKGQESAIFLIAGEDALDQYFMQNPQEFFNRPSESAIISPYNPYILQKHLECAAAELTLEKQEIWLQESEVQEQVHELCMQGLLLQNAHGDQYHAARKRPHLTIDLRGTGSTFNIIERIAIQPKNFWLNTLSNETPVIEQSNKTALVNISSKSQIIGTVDIRQAYTETHEGAIYLHRGQQYLVDTLDFATKSIYVHKENVTWHTRVRTNKNTEILEEYAQTKVFGIQVGFGKLKVTENITGYERRQNNNLKLLSIKELNYPPLTFDTEGLWFIIPEYCIQLLEKNFFHFMGAIHAFEHITIGLMPLIVMADRNDIGGISIPYFDALKSPAVFIYDGCAGGAGLCKKAFQQLETLLKAVLKRLSDCTCELGCPSCVISPKCGSGNRPIDKDGAKLLVKTFIENTVYPDEIPQIYPQLKKETTMNIHNYQKIMVLDVETRYSADEVGGWNNADKMGVSIAVLFDSENYQSFTQDELPTMFELMKQADIIIGFNTLNFDYKVLQPFCSYDLWSLPSLDLLYEIKKRLNYRVSLDNLASSTFNTNKSANGLLALKWWKEGNINDIIKYCQKDVEITKQLFEFGKENNYVLFTNKAGQKVRIPVTW